MNERMSPKGTLLTTRGPGNLSVGSRVSVVRGQFGRRPGNLVSSDHVGHTGKFLGWSIPNGFAVVQTDGGAEFLVDPASLERSR
jgi:hypothetical protein